jgi:dimethylhistidine N-methyltransferase
VSAALSSALPLAPQPPRVVLCTQADPAREREALLAGLLDAEAHVEPRFFYDAQGCALFGAICQLDEYYPTRTEAGIFAEQLERIVAQLPRRLQWIDLGCGDGAKSQDWLRRAEVRRYVGVDIAADWLPATVRRIGEGFPQIEALGVVADLAQPFALRELIGERPQYAPLFFYPGSSIGNFKPGQAVALLRGLRLAGGERSRLLIGVDLAKDRATLDAAYDDALGVTAAFNRNLLRVVNRLFGADFDPRAWEHRAHWQPLAQRVEMQLLARQAQTVSFRHPRAATRRFPAGEVIVTEHSYKYTPEGFAQLLDEAGFTRQDCWTDPLRHYAVFLAAP